MDNFRNAKMDYVLKDCTMKKLLKFCFNLIILLSITGCATSHYYTMESKEFKDFDYGFDTKYVQVRNINIAMIDEGKSEKVLVLIHGLGSNAKGWIKNIPELAKNYRVIALDLPGYAKSDKGYYKYSLPFYAKVLTEMMDVMKIEKATLIGHSMGGQIAMITSLNYPDYVENLVLISPAGFERFLLGEGEWLRNAVTPEFVNDTPIRNIDINLRSNFYEMPEDAEFMVTERIQMRGAKDFNLYCYAVSKNVGAMIDAPVWDKLEKIKHPTLIMFGRNDALIPNPYLHAGYTEDVAKYGEDRIPDNKLIMYEKTGHFVQFESWDKVNQDIIDFMKD